jgi:phenylalanyl-tRNA synthetase beta chain
VLEIDNKSLTHRPDLWGHRGLAGEVAAIFRRELKPLDTRLPETGKDEPFPVHIDSADCPRYLALCIDGARPLPSPGWLRWLLLAVGQKPSDQLVDLSNFVMLDLGQPNHVFDRRRLAAGRIDVRNARAGETLTVLDGTECALIPADLLICSGEEPVALAGVMGGEASKVTGDTSELLLEVANFQPAVVRRTAMRLGTRTDASARFEKSLDPHLCATAAGHFARLLLELQPEVRLPAPPTDVGDWSDPACRVTLRPARARALLGAEISDAQMQSILERLGFGVSPQAGGLAVDVPSARATKDVTAEHDLIEEIGRIHRYGEIPERDLEGRVVPPARDEARRLSRALQDRLAGGARFHEAATYSFHADDLLERAGQASLPHVRIVNPVLETQSRVRRSVLPGLLDLLERNRREQDDVRLFEIGKGYRPELGADGEPREVHQLALVWCGKPPADGERFDAARFSRLQGVLVDLLESLALETPTWSQAEQVPSWAHPRRALAAHWGRAAEGPASILLAELEPGVARAMGLAGELASDCAAAEVDLGALLAAPRRASRYQPLPRFPGSKVDVAVSLADETSAAEVEAAIRSAGKADVARVELFDLYRGPNLGPGKKSLAYHVLLQSDSRTLGEEDGRKFLARLERQLERLGAELRKG